MKRVLLLCVAIAVALVQPLSARADIGVISISGTFTQRQDGTFIPITSQSSCSVIISGNGQNFRVMPVITNDGSRSSAPIISINQGLITANGTYSGALPNQPTILGTGVALRQDSSVITGTVNYTLTCTASNYFGALRNGTAALVPADGSASAAVPFANSFAASVTSVTLTPGNYSGSDNAAISCFLTGAATVNGFNAECVGGVPGSTVTVNYTAAGQ